MSRYWDVARVISSLSYWGGGILLRPHIGSKTPGQGQTILRGRLGQFHLGGSSIGSHDGRVQQVEANDCDIRNPALI